MRHWAEGYLSIPYQKLNCVELVEKVLKEQFNKKYNFPQSNKNIFGESRMIRQNMEKYLDKNPVPEPMEGDLALMSGVHELCHIGLVVYIKGKLRILHSIPQAKSTCLHSKDDLIQYGLIIKGFYTWLR